MAAVLTSTQVAGLLKEVYSPDGVITLIPDAMHILKSVKFSKAESVGDKFVQPVVVSKEHGYSYSGPGGGAFSLNPAISMNMKKALVDVYQMVGKHSIDYDTMARASNGDKASFQDATELQMENAMTSATQRLEIAALYGQSGIGEAASSVNIGATSTTVTFTTATWSSGIWSGAEGAEVTFWDTVANTLISSGDDSIFTVSNVDPDLRTVVFLGTATGITALDIGLAGALKANVHLRGTRTGASTFGEMIGLKNIITNAGTLFNIDAAAYSLWRGNNYSAAGALTTAKLQSAVAKAVVRGLAEDVTVYVNPLAWSSLLNDQAALRRYDSSYKSAEINQGAKSIKFYSQNGSMEIVSHLYVKEGDAFIVPVSRLKRIGSYDLSFNTPGMSDEQMVRQLDGQAGYEFRTYTSQQIFCSQPSKTVFVTGIVNS